MGGVSQGIYNYQFTAQDQGGDDTLDSDVNADGITAFFALSMGQEKDLDAGLFFS